MTGKVNRILITSAGGLVGTFLIKHFQEVGNYYLVGTDMSEYVPLKEKLDAYYQVVPNRSEAYLDNIRRIIEKEQIEIVLPISSYDVEMYSKKEIRKQVEPAKMLLLDYEIYKILHNKGKCNKFLKQLEISVPRIYCGEKEIKFPCVLKPDEGTGSKNVIYLEMAEDYLYWKKKIQGYTLYEYLEGKEYTVDCLFDYSGKCVGYNARERVKMNGGGAVISKCIKEERLTEIIEKLELQGNIRGPINFQYKVVDNRICIFDFNTRFASGGLPLTVYVGFDIPQMLIELILGKQVKPWSLSENAIGSTMFRYYEESYERK